MTRGRPPIDRTRKSFATDLVEVVRDALQSYHANALLSSRIEQRDEVARRIADQLCEPKNAEHVRCISRAFGVPFNMVRLAIALEIGRARVRESEAREAVAGRFGR